MSCCQSTIEFLVLFQFKLVRFPFEEFDSRTKKRDKVECEAHCTEKIERKEKLKMTQGKKRREKKGD